MPDLKLLFLETYWTGSQCGETNLFLQIWIYLIYVIFVFDIYTPLYSLCTWVSFFFISINLYYLSKKKKKMSILICWRGAEDQICWSPMRSGIFEVKSFYKELHAGPGSLFPWKSIWKVNVLPKGSVFYLDTGFGTDSYFG